MKPTNIPTLAVPLAILAAGMANAATLVVTNSDFSGTLLAGNGTTAHTNTNNPTGYTVVEGTANPNPDGIYVSSDSGSPILHFKDGDGTVGTQYIQQNITTANGGVDATTYDTYTLTLDLGWRTDNSPNTAADFRISLWNITDNTELAFTTYTLATRGTGLFNSYSFTQMDKAFTLSYDNTAGGLTGDAIGFRIQRYDADDTSSGNNWNNTAIADNIRLAAVPEPSAALLGGLGLLGLLRRRR